MAGIIIARARLPRVLPVRARTRVCRARFAHSKTGTSVRPAPGRQEVRRAQRATMSFAWLVERFSRSLLNKRLLRDFLMEELDEQQVLSPPSCAHCPRARPSVRAGLCARIRMYREARVRAWSLRMRGAAGIAAAPRPLERMSCETRRFQLARAFDMGLGLWVEGLGFRF